MKDMGETEGLATGLCGLYVLRFPPIPNSESITKLFLLARSHIVLWVGISVNSMPISLRLTTERLVRRVSLFHEWFKVWFKFQLFWYVFQDSDCDWSAVCISLHTRQSLSDFDQFKSSQWSLGSNMFEPLFPMVVRKLFFQSLLLLSVKAGIRPSKIPSGFLKMKIHFRCCSTKKR